MSKTAQIQEPMIDRALALYNEGKEFRSLDLIFDHIDDLLLDGEFETVDRELEEMEISSPFFDI